MKVKLLPQVRLFLFQCLMTMLIALPLGAKAQYNGNYWNNGGQNYFNNSPITTQINRYLGQGDQINVLRSLRLNQSEKLVSLSVTAQSNQYDSKLVLLLNGQRLSAQKVSPYTSQLLFNVPNLLQGDKLVLKVRGAAFIQSLSGTLSGNNWPNQNPNAPIKARIDQQFFGHANLKVRKILKDFTGTSLQGMKLKKVIMKASSVDGRAQATLLINGRPVGYSQNLPMQPTRIVFELPSWGQSQNIVGQDIRSIQVALNGRQMHVKMLGVKVQAHGPHQGQMNSVQLNVHRRFQGSERVTLSQLAGYNQQLDMNRQIEAITVVASGHGNIMLAGAGRGQGGIRVQGQTTQSINLMGQFVTAGDLRLRVSGNLMIQSIRVKFKRSHW